MGVVLYSYSQLPKEIAQSLPAENELKRIFADS